MNNQELKEMLQKMAKLRVWSDDPDFMVDDYAAGSIDDAYYGGVSDGEVCLARHILKELEKE